MEKGLDRAFLKKYYNGTVEGLDEIYEIFLEETPLAIDELKEAVRAEDFEAALAILHKINPSFTSIGLPEISVCVKELEDYISNGRCLNRIVALIDMFVKDFEEYLPAIQKEYTRLKALSTSTR